MAKLVNDGNINWDGNWQTVGKNDTLHGSINLNVDSGSIKYSGLWNGASANTDIGFLCYLAAENNTGTITVELQEDTGGGSWVTRSSTTLVIDSTTKTGYLFFKYSASHTEVTGTNNYRIKFTSSTSSDTNFRSNNADTSVIAVTQVLSATATLSSGDEAWVVGHVTGATGNPTADTVTVNVNSATGYTLYITNGGVLTWAVGQTTKLTITSPNLQIDNGGTMSIGTSGTPIESAYVGELAFEPSSTGKIINRGVINVQGASKTYYRTSLNAAISAGAKSFVTVDTTGWAVGDEIIVTTTSSTRTQTELVVITGISGTTIYIDSNGDGTGASPVFANAHDTSALILNITRNAKITSSVGSGNSYLQMAFGSGDFDWASFKGLRGSFSITTEYNAGSTCGNMNYVVIRDNAGGGGIDNNNGDGIAYPDTLQDTIFYNLSGRATQLVNIGNWGAPTNVIKRLFSINCSSAIYGSIGSYTSNDIVIEDLFAVASNGHGVEMHSSQQILYLTNVYAQCNNGSGLQGSGFLVVRGHRSGYNVRGFTTWSATVCFIREYDAMYGSDGTNDKANSGNDIQKGDGNYANVGGYYLGHGIKTTSAKINWYAGAPAKSPGFDVRISNLGRVASRHILKTFVGSLSDQITAGKTAAWAKGGSGICLYADPTSQSTALLWDFLVPVTAAQAFQLAFYITKSTSGFNGSVKVTIYDSLDFNTILLNAETIPNGSIPLNDGTGDDWTYEYQSTSVNPSATGFCRVIVEFLDGATTGDLLVDSVRVI